MSRGVLNQSLSPRFIVLDQMPQARSQVVSLAQSLFDEFKSSLGQQKLNFISFENHSSEIEEMLGNLAKSINFETYNVYQFSNSVFSEKFIDQLKQIIKAHQGSPGNFILFSLKPTITLIDELSVGVFMQTHSLVSLTNDVNKKKELWGQMKKAFKI